MKRLIGTIAFIWFAVGPCSATTFFIRSDGGTRYSANEPYGQCNGQADAAYTGTVNNLWAASYFPALNYTIVDSNANYEKITVVGTTNTTPPTWPSHGGGTIGVTTTVDNDATWTYEGPAPFNASCAYKDFRYTFDDGSYGNFAWVISGGDTVVIRGCHAAYDQENPSNPNCRIGVDLDTGTSGSSGFCVGSQPNTNCFNPAVPAGTSGAHTRILGGCAYDGDCNPVNTYPYTSNLTQLFGGFGAGTVLNLSGTSYVDVEGLEITSHNGACSRVGAPNYPTSCSTSSPISDYVTQGISTGDTSSNILFQDIYEHGVNSSGFFGSIGGPITMTRVISAFNAFAGYNFDDGNPDGAGSSVTASYVWMEGNGCQEEYPIVHTSYPAVACWDTNSGGFGDSWSGQTTNLDAFACDHCTTIYNTKDGFIGPHALVKNLSLTHSAWYGNMGSQLKWGTQANGSTLFQNNFVNGNCYAMSVQIPGAGQNFNQSTALGGSYLTGYCRADGSPFAISSSANSTFLFAGNTVVANIAETTLQMSAVSGAIASTTWQFTDNIFLGYAVPGGYGPFGGGYTPAVYYTDDPLGPTDMIVHSDHNLFYGNRNDDCTGGYGGVTLTSTSPICASPMLAGQPSTYSSESVFFPLIPSTSNVYPTPGTSPAIHAGIAVSGMTNDYYSVPRPTSPTVGFAEPSSYYITGSGASFATGSGFATCTVSSGVSIPVGSVVFFTAGSNNVGAFSPGGPSDGHNTYTLLTSSLNGIEDVWYTTNTFAGVLTISVNLGRELQSCSVAAYSVPMTSTLDGSPQQTALTISPTQPAGPLTTTNALDTVMVISNGYANSTGTATPGYTQDFSGGPANFYSLNTTSAGTYSATVGTNNGGSGGGNVYYVAFTDSLPTASTPTYSPVAGTYSGTQSVSLTTVSAGAIICYNTTGSPATNGGAGCTTGTLYSGPISVSASETIYSVAGGTGWLDSSVGSAAYTITGAGTGVVLSGGVKLGGGIVVQ